MASRDRLARNNLKKSVMISAVIVTGAAAAGFAVSIPVYERIQKSLIASKTKLSDLSSMMYQLVNKLGVAPDASFQKQLSGGYVLTYTNGKTEVYKTVNGHQVLIVNMNADNTVGSASTKDGVAAQTMLSVLTEAEHLFKSEKDAMKDIIDEYAVEAEKESLETESAITGESAEVIKLRNAMSDTNIRRREAAVKELTKNMSAQDAAKAKADAKKIIDAAKKVEDKRLKRIRDMKTAEANGEAALKAEKERQIAEIKKEAEDKEAALKNIEGKLLLAKKLRMQNWIKNKHVEINHSDIPDDLTKLTALYNKLHEIDVKRDMNEVITQQGAKHANRNIIDMLATSFTKWVPFYIKVHNGYLKRNGHMGAKSPMAENLMKKRLLSKGLSESKYNEITTWADKIVSDNGGPTKVKISFKEIVNNYNDKNDSISRLSVIKVSVANGTVFKDYIVTSRSTMESSIGVEKIKFFDNKSYTETLEKIAVLSSLAERKNGYLELTRKLVDILNGDSSIPLLPNTHIYEELLKMYNIKNRIVDDGEKVYAGQKIHTLLKKYILQLQPITIHAEELMEYIHVIYSKDKTTKKNATLDPKDPLFSIAPTVGWKDLMDRFFNSTNINKVDIPKHTVVNMAEFNKAKKEVRDFVVHIGFSYVFNELGKDNGSGARIFANSEKYMELKQHEKEILRTMPVVLLNKFFKTNSFFSSFKTLCDSKGAFKDIVFRTHINNLIKMSDTELHNLSSNINEIEALNSHSTYTKFLNLLEANQHNRILHMISMSTSDLRTKIKPRIEHFLTEYDKLSSINISIPVFNEIVTKLFDTTATTQDVNKFVDDQLSYYGKLNDLKVFLYTKIAKIDHSTTDQVIRYISSMPIIQGKTRVEALKTFDTYLRLMANYLKDKISVPVQVLFYNMSRNIKTTSLPTIYQRVIDFNNAVTPLVGPGKTINDIADHDWPGGTLGWTYKGLYTDGRPFSHADQIIETN